jgi:cell division protease FtsH
MAAFERWVAGAEKRRPQMPVGEKRRVAVHELGHALVAMVLNRDSQLHKVSIIPHGMTALGYTVQTPREEHTLSTRSQLLDQMAVLMAGQASEVLCFGEPSTGAADDLVKATDLAGTMVTECGMDESVGMLALRTQKSLILEADIRDTISHLGPDMAQRIADAMQSLLKQSQDRATAILQCNRTLLDEATELLLARESLAGSELAALRARLVDPV